MITFIQIDTLTSAEFIGDGVVIISQDSDQVHITAADILALADMIPHSRSGPTAPTATPTLRPMPCERRMFSPAFKRDAVEATAYEAQATVARRLSISPKLLARWRRQAAATRKHV